MRNAPTRTQTAMAIMTNRTNLEGTFDGFPANGARTSNIAPYDITLSFLFVPHPMHMHLVGHMPFPQDFSRCPQFLEANRTYAPHTHSQNTFREFAFLLSITAKAYTSGVPPPSPSCTFLGPARYVIPRLVWSIKNASALTRGVRKGNQYPETEQPMYDTR